MSNPETAGVVDASKEKMLEEIRVAKGKALPFEDIQRMKDVHNEATRAFLRGESSYEQMQESFHSLDDQAGVIQRKSITEFISLLRAIGLTDEDTKRIAAHENEHLVEALTRGAEPLYQIQFMTRTASDGKIQMGIYPSVAVYWPDDVPTENIKEGLTSIIAAPAKLSSSDRAKLGE
ncbi:hypothetical protein KGQ55_01455 [Patescibacteria group bacterium]|nr:hypothetical protein [Patescibacteria group bacterium]